MKRAMLGWASVLIVFLTLHQPDGKATYVNSEQLDLISPADSANPGAQTRMLVYGVRIAVREAPAEVAQMIDIKT